MQSNIFAKVAPLLKERQLNIDCDSVVSFLGKYHKNTWIYPSALYRELKIDLKEIYEILELCVEIGLLKQYLQIYCPRCQRFTGAYYETVFDIPSEVACIHCDDEVEYPLKHAVIIYKVL